MLVIADTSPLIVLIKIEHAAVLPSLFGEVIIPPEVAGELQAVNRPRVVREFVASHPAWLLERSPKKLESIPSLQAGELAAISLAIELNADLLLIDELQGRKEAAARGLALTGTDWRLGVGGEGGACQPSRCVRQSEANRLLGIAKAARRTA